MKKKCFEIKLLVIAFMQKVLIIEILYIESQKDYIKLFLSNVKNLLGKQSISSTENLLSEHKFLRLHCSYMVAINKISGYNAFSIQVQSTGIPMGRLYKQAVMERLRET